MRTTQKLVAGGVMTIVAVAGMVAARHPAVTAAADVPSQASIASVRSHALTPSAIVTEQHLAARGGCATSIVSFHSDGLKEYALVQRPASRPPGSGYPVIIFAHGYTPPAAYRTDNTQYGTIMNYYCQHRYLVFKPDYRGHGASGGVADNGLYSPVDTYDVLNLAASLGSYPLADASRLALVGHSMGGGIVLRAAVAPHGLPIKAVVTLAGAVGSLPQMTYHWTGLVPPDVMHKRAQVMHIEGPPSQNSGYWHDADATNYLDSLQAPVQINQGLSDASVPASFAAHLDAQLTAASKPHEYYTYPATGHLFGNPAAMNSFLGRSVTFIGRNE